MIKVSSAWQGRDLLNWANSADVAFQPIVSAQSLRVHRFEALKRLSTKEGSMRQIVYISTAVSTFQTADLGPLLYEARYSNLRAGVTGALLFGGKQFLQALEGEVDDVRATYKRICRDKRHTKIELLSDKNVSLREFGNWDMATRICEASNFTTRVDDLARSVSCPEIKQIFENFGTTK